MTGSNQTTFAVSKQAGKALRDLAKHHGLSSAALIERLVEDERKACKLEALPDYLNWTALDEGTFVFEIGEGEKMEEFNLSLMEADRLTWTLGHVAKVGGSDTCGSSDYYIEVKRRGLSTVLSVKDARFRKGFREIGRVAFTITHALQLAETLKADLRAHKRKAKTAAKRVSAEAA